MFVFIIHRDWFFFLSFVSLPSFQILLHLICSRSSQCRRGCSREKKILRKHQIEQQKKKENSYVVGLIDNNLSGVDWLELYLILRVFREETTTTTTSAPFSAHWEKWKLLHMLPKKKRTHTEPGWSSGLQPALWTGPAYLHARWWGFFSSATQDTLAEIRGRTEAHL